MTECTALAFVIHPKDNTVGHVGGICTGLEAKIIDVPSMDYLATDKDKDGNVTPRGEICLRGPQIFAGYYKCTELYEQAVDKERWLHTGDIGQMMPNGTLRIIDRKKNIFKL